MVISVIAIILQAGPIDVEPKERYLAVWECDDDEKEVWKSLAPLQVKQEWPCSNKYRAWWSQESCIPTPSTINMQTEIEQIRFLEETLR